MKYMIIDLMQMTKVTILCGYLMVMVAGVPFTVVLAAAHPDIKCEIKSRWFYVGFPLHYACQFGKYMSQPMGGAE